mgnify:CR=1 FL=1
MKRKNKKFKIKWKNVLLLMLLLLCAYVVAHDVFMLTVYPLVTDKYVGWTWFGFATFIMAFALGGVIVEYIDTEINE